MSLTDKINQDIKAAMLAKEKDKLAALRAIKSALLLEATSGKGEVTENAELKILQKLFKQRKDAAEIFQGQKRDDLAQEELSQAEIIANYLPKMLDENEVRVEVRKIIDKLGEVSPSDMGKVMGKVMPVLNGKAEGKIISKVVKEELI